MTAGQWFWLVYVLLALACCGLYYPFGPESRRPLGVSLIVLVLVGLLGWGIFGPPIR